MQINTSINRFLVALFLLANFSSAFSQTQLGVDIDGEAANDASGYSVSMSTDGTRIAIGAHLNDSNGENSGHVRVYELDSGFWTQLGPDIDGEASNDYFGISVSLSGDGNRVAIGAPHADGYASDVGHVQIYDFDGVDWVQVGTDIDGEAIGVEFGFSVSLSTNGNRVAAGDRFNDGMGNSAGHVQVFELIGGDWVQLGTNIDGEAIGDLSGLTVSISNDGGRVAIGAPHNDGNGSNSGHVRIYEWNGNNWAQLGSDIDGESAVDLSGYPVALSSNGFRVAIAAQGNDENGAESGHVRVYEWNGSNWGKLGTDINGETIDDHSGLWTSISADGNRVAIGASQNDGNGNRAGHVRVYEWNGSNWVQLGYDIDGEASEDFSGFAVSMSNDGLRVAIGAHNNDGNGNTSGHVRVYENLTNLPVELVYFRAKKYNGFNYLTWATASEINNEHFIIEHSIDGINFSIIGQLNGNNTSSLQNKYEFEHHLPVIGINYYRLKQVDFDGAFEYSKIINVINKTTDKIGVYPNPTSGIFEVFGLEKEALLHLRNVLGVKIKSMKTENHRIDISELLEGVYFISIDVDGQITTKTLLKKS